MKETDLMVSSLFRPVHKNTSSPLKFDRTVFWDCHYPHSKVVGEHRVSSERMVATGTAKYRDTVIADRAVSKESRANL